MINIDMKKLGVDQSLTGTGIVLLEDDNMLFFDRFVTKKNEDGDQFERVNRICEYITKVLDGYSPNHVTFEGISFGSRGDATRTLAGLQFHLVIETRKRGYATNIIPPPTLKKFATGSGKAGKDEIVTSLPAEILSSFKHAGFKKTQIYDLADAYWLAKYDIT